MNMKTARTQELGARAAVFATTMLIIVASLTLAAPRAAEAQALVDCPQSISVRYDVQYDMHSRAHPRSRIKDIQNWGMNRRSQFELDNPKRSVLTLVRTEIGNGMMHCHYDANAMRASTFVWSREESDGCSNKAVKMSRFHMTSVSGHDNSYYTFFLNSQRPDFYPSGMRSRRSHTNAPAHKREYHYNCTIRPRAGATVCVSMQLRHSSSSKRYTCAKSGSKAVRCSKMKPIKRSGGGKA